MTEAYDGRQVVGIDLHRRRSVLVRMTEDGRKLETVRITNSAAARRREIAKAGKHPLGSAGGRVRLVLSRGRARGSRGVAAEHQVGQAEYLAREQVDDLEQHPAS